MRCHLGRCLRGIAGSSGSGLGAIAFSAATWPIPPSDLARCKSRQTSLTMAAAAAQSTLLRVFARRPAAAALTSAAAASGRAVSSSALRGGAGSFAGGRLAVATRRLGALHGAAVVCSAGGADEGVVEVQLKVEGMVCDGCSSRVEETLAKMAGVKKVHVDLDKGLATVSVEAASQMDAFAAVQPLAEAIKGLGFEAEPHFGSE